MNPTVSLFLFCFLIFSSAVCADTAPANLRELTEMVAARNPTVQAAHARWQMFRSRVPQAAAWQDLTVGVDVERSRSLNPSRYSDLEWMVMQEVPISGRNRSRARVAAAEAEAALEEYRRALLDAVAAARKAWFDLGNAAAQIEVNERNVDLLNQFMDISRVRYETGGQSQTDVLLAEREVVTLQERGVDLVQAQVEALTRLNVLMNREPSAPLAPPVLAFTPFRPAMERLRGLTLAHRPELRQAERTIASRANAVELAKRQWIPDPQLRVEARNRRDDGRTGIAEIDTGIFFSIPWGNARKYRAGEEEAAHGLTMAERELTAQQSAAAGLVRDHVARIETLRHHYELFRDRLLPVARQLVDAARASYESDRGSLLPLITSQQTARDLEAGYYEHLADYEKALADLEAIVGTDLHFFPVPTTPVSQNSK